MVMVRAKRTKEPVYKKLKDTIIREIKNRTLKPDDRILSERLLSEQFNISRISVRKGLKDLIGEGFLYTVPGKGTFVKGIISGIKRSREKTYNLAYIFWGGDRSIIKIPYFAHIVAGAEREARKSNYHLIISSFDPTQHTPNSLPSIIEQGKVDGAILEGVYLNVYRQINKILPVVTISNYLCQDPGKTEAIEDIDYIAANNQSAAINLVEYLYSLGHRKMAFLMGSPIHSSFRERLNGFILGSKMMRMKPHEEWIIMDAKDGVSAFKKILSAKVRPTAIVACNDSFALDIINYCKEHDIGIPDEFSIVGFDDIESSAWSQPPLTTIRVLTDEMGEKAANRLIDKIENPGSLPTTLLIGTQLIERESCRAISSRQS